MGGNCGAIMRVVLAVIAICFAVSSVWAHGAYRLKPGDVIEIWVGQDENLNRKVKVRPDGRISLPLAGHLRASGLTPEQLEGTLRKRLQKNFTAQLDLTVMLVESAVRPEVEPATRSIYVTGEVAKPGIYEIEEPTTVLQALAIAGGVGQFAAKRRIHVRRRHRSHYEVIPFNYKDVESGHDLTGNIYLHNGDVVIVPERGLFE